MMKNNVLLNNILKKLFSTEFDEFLISKKIYAQVLKKLYWTLMFIVVTSFLVNKNKKKSNFYWIYNYNTWKVSDTLIFMYCLFKKMKNWKFLGIQPLFFCKCGSKIFVKLWVFAASLNSFVSGNSTQRVVSKIINIFKSAFPPSKFHIQVQKLVFLIFIKVI